MQNTPKDTNSLVTVDTGNPQIGIIYFRGTQTARAAICTSIVSISRERSEGEFSTDLLKDI